MVADLSAGLGRSKANQFHAAIICSEPSGLVLELLEIGRVMNLGGRYKRLKMTRVLNQSINAIGRSQFTRLLHGGILLSRLQACVLVLYLFCHLSAAKVCHAHS